MILLIPYTRFTLITNLSKSEVNRRLFAHVEPRTSRRRLPHNHEFFAGSVRNGEFNINRIAHHNLPSIITGQIYDELGITKIKIVMRLSYFFIGFIAILIAIAIRLFFFSRSELDTSDAISFFCFLIAFYGIAVGIFNFEVNKARRYLEEIFQINAANF